MASDYSNVPDLADTSERQAALRRYHILDTEPEKNFDHITSLVAKVCEVPTALITLIDEERQWFKSCFGFDARETDIGISFCVHAVHQGEMLVIEDATEDPRFKDNPIVTGPPHVRFYAGAPLTTPDGIHIGTLCILDYEARTFDAAQREILERLADVVVNQFELRSAEAQVRQLVDQNPQPMYVYAQSDGSLLRANEAARDLYGHDGDVSSLTAADLEAPAEDQPSSEALSMHARADGSYFPVRLRKREVLFDGRAAVLAVPQSVSERHDTDTTVFFQTDLAGTTQSLSAAWSDATGFAVEDAVGTRFLDFVHPLDRSSTADVFSSLLDGAIDTCQHEATFLTESGSKKFELNARLVYDADGKPNGATGTLIPIIEEESSPSSGVETEGHTPDSSPTDEPARTGDDLADDDPAPASRDHAEPASSTNGENEHTPEAADASEDEAPESTRPPETDDASSPAREAADAVETPPSAEETPSDEEASSAEEPPASDPDADRIGGVFSTDLPSFAGTEPSSPSAPINGPSEETTASDSADTSSPSSSTDDADASSSSDDSASRTLQPEPFDFVAQIRDVLDTKDHAARQENVALRRSLPDGSLPVRLDPQAVRHMVDALIDEVLPRTTANALTVRADASDDHVFLHLEGLSATTAQQLGLETSDPNLSSTHALVDEIGGSLDQEDTDDGDARVSLTLPRSSTPSGDGSASILF